MFLEIFKDYFRFIEVPSSSALNKDVAEDRSLSSNNIGAALSNYADSFFLIKMLLIFWLHVRRNIKHKGIIDNRVFQ